METGQVKNFYNESLQASTNPYEQDRWFKKNQAKAGYINTKSALWGIVPKYLKDGCEVFELGPGPGTWTKELLMIAPQASYTLVDISEEMLKQAKDALSGRDNIDFVCSDILNLKPSKQYDFFFSSRMLEYVPEKEGALQSIADSLKPGAFGYLVTKTPQYGRSFGKKVNSPVHQTQVTAEDLIQSLHACGLEVVEKKHVTCVFPKLRSGVLDRILTTVCRFLPFQWCVPVSESYAVVFQKK